MDYMTLKEAAEKWGVTPRRVNYYCAGGTSCIRGYTRNRDNLQLSPYNITLLHCIIHTLPVECCYMQFS